MKYTFFLLAYAVLFLVLPENNYPVAYSGKQTTYPMPPGTPVHPVIFIPAPAKGTDLQPSLQAALDTAHSGDELRLPEGAYTICKTLFIRKYISIRGAGISRTLLSRPEYMPDSLLSSDSLKCMFRFCPETSSPVPVTISDISFQSKRPSSKAGDKGSLAADIALEFIHCNDFTVTHCRFEYFGYAAISVIHNDSIARGLICKNQFYHNTKGADGLGLGYGIVVFGENKTWIADPRFGSDNFIFVEDNYFEQHRHAIAAGGCGLYVFRYNTVMNNNIGQASGQAVDAHEARKTPGLNYYSTRAVEIYNNRLINYTFKSGKPIVPGHSAKELVENAILIRGGEAVIHDNRIQGYRFGVGLINFEATDSDTYPLFTQPGYSSARKYGAEHSGKESPFGDGDLFSWDNPFTPYASSDSSCVFYNYQSRYFKFGRDYHLEPKPHYKPFAYPHPPFDNQE
jgi:hypothetical protein